MQNSNIACEDDVIYLRPMTEADTTEVLSWRNSEYVVKRFIFREKVTEEMHRNFINNHIKTGDTVQFIIGIKETGEEIGCTHLQHIDADKHYAEIGAFIGEEKHSGRGIGTRAFRLTIDWAKEHGITKLESRILADNEASIKSFLKNGFVRMPEKDYKALIDNHYEDVIFMMREGENSGVN